MLEPSSNHCLLLLDGLGRALVAANRPLVAWLMVMPQQTLAISHTENGSALTSQQSRFLAHCHHAIVPSTPVAADKVRPVPTFVNGPPPL